MRKKPHKEYEKNVIHPAVQRFLEEEFKAKVFFGVSIPLVDFPKPVTRVSMDLLGLTDDCSILVECKPQTVPYSFAVGLGELLLYRTLLKSKKLQVEKEIKERIREPILPYLSVVDFGHSQNINWYRYAVWSDEYLRLYRDFKLNFTKDFNPGLILVKRKRDIDKPAQDLTSEDIYIEPILRI